MNLRYLKRFVRYLRSPEGPGPDTRGEKVGLGLGVLAAAGIVLLALWLAGLIFQGAVHYGFWDKDQFGLNPPESQIAVGGAAGDYPVLSSQAVGVDVKAPLSAWGFGYPRGTHGQNNPQAIVLHVIAGSAAATCQNVVDYFAGPNGVGIQFFICENGTIYQLAELDDAVWHAGLVQSPNLRNPIISAWVRDGWNPNMATVGIELDLTPGQQLADYPAMENSLRILLVWLRDTLAIPLDRDHVIAHGEIDSVTRAGDPWCCVGTENTLLGFNDWVLALVADLQPEPPPAPTTTESILTSLCGAMNDTLNVAEYGLGIQTSSDYRTRPELSAMWSLRLVVNWYCGQVQ